MADETTKTTDTENDEPKASPVEPGAPEASPEEVPGRLALGDEIPVEEASDAEVEEGQFERFTGAAVRDFIPEGEPLRPAERARIDRIVGNFVTKPDFIPDPNTPAAPVETREDRIKEAQRRAAVDVAQAHAEDVANATDRLKQFNQAQAIDFIDAQSEYMKGVFKTAERKGENRRGVMEHLEGVDEFKPTVEPSPKEKAQAGAKKPFKAQGRKGGPGTENKVDQSSPTAQDSSAKQRKSKSQAKREAALKADETKKDES